MAKDLYVYDVFDTETESYILEDAPLSKVSEQLKIDGHRIINAIKYGQKLDRRYVVTRSYLDGTKNPNDIEPDVVVPEDLKMRWNEARFTARRALRNPMAVKRFLEKKRSMKEGCV